MASLGCKPSNLMFEFFVLPRVVVPCCYSFVANASGIQQGNGRGYVLQTGVICGCLKGVRSPSPRLKSLKGDKMRFFALNCLIPTVVITPKTYLMLTPPLRLIQSSAIKWLTGLKHAPNSHGWTLMKQNNGRGSKYIRQNRIFLTSPCYTNALY